MTLSTSSASRFATLLDRTLRVLSSHIAPPGPTFDVRSAGNSQLTNAWLALSIVNATKTALEVDHIQLVVADHDGDDQANTALVLSSTARRLIAGQGTVRMAPRDEITVMFDSQTLSNHLRDHGPHVDVRVEVWLRGSVTAIASHATASMVSLSEYELLFEDDEYQIAVARASTMLPI